MKNNNTILKDLISDFIANQNKITYFGKDSVIRAIFWAIANTLVEVWNDIFQTKRKMQVDTAEGADLDYLAGRYSLTRLTATKSSVILIFNGTAGTVIPQGTQVKNTGSGEIYETKNAITLGTQNPLISRPLYNNFLGDIVVAESLNTGAKTYSYPDEITEITPSIAGVTATNSVPTVGGQDSETDSQLRDRIKSYPNTLSQGTQLFFESLAKKHDTSVLKAIAKYDNTTGGVLLYVVKNTLAVFTQQQLTDLENLVYGEQRGLSPVSCLNAPIKGIEVKFRYTRDSAVLEDTIFRDLVTKLSDFINPLNMTFGTDIYYSDILEIALSIDGILTIDIPSFTVNGGKSNINCLYNEVPRLYYVDITGDVTNASIISQTFLALE